MPRNQDDREDNNSDYCDKPVMTGLGSVGLVGSAGVGFYEAETIICAGAWTGWNVCLVSSAAGCALVSILCLLRGCASEEPPTVELQNVAVSENLAQPLLETPTIAVAPYDAASAPQKYSSYGSTDASPSSIANASVSSSSGSTAQLTAGYTEQGSKAQKPEDEVDDDTNQLKK